MARPEKVLAIGYQSLANLFCLIPRNSEKVGEGAALSFNKPVRKGFSKLGSVAPGDRSDDPVRFKKQ